MSFYRYAPYVPVAQRRQKAAREMKKLEKDGRKISPVVIEGRAIARNFWGKAWCENLERYSDYENRLPRGRTYVRNGSVVDLQIGRGNVRAMVSGSEIYKVGIDIATMEPKSWRAICGDCRGAIASLVELLRGKLSKNVMERVCRQGDGLFPAPKEIKMSCSCPDGARMCKHVAAVMYGAGARLDHAPDLLFTLRGVDRADMIGNAGADAPMTQLGRASERVLADDDLEALFGIEMEPAPSGPAVKQNKKPPPVAPVATTQIRPSKVSLAGKKQPPSKTTAVKRLKRVEFLPPVIGNKTTPSAIAGRQGAVKRVARAKLQDSNKTVAPIPKTPKDAASPRSVSAPPAVSSSAPGSRTGK